MQSNIDTRVLDALWAAIDEFNLSQPEDQQMEKAPETVLLGADSKLDSLGLVNLLITVEQQIATDLNIPLTLASEKAFSMRNSPFATIASLTQYLQQLVLETAQ